MKLPLHPDKPNEVPDDIDWLRERHKHLRERPAQQQACNN